MNTGRIVFERSPQKSVSLDRILQVTLEALKQGDFITALDQFNDEFAFIDHALELEFSAKDRLTDFFAKRRRLFPEFERTDNIVLSGEDRIVSEWFLTTTKRGSLPESWMEVPICMRGASIVRIENGKITQWSDYYDQLQSGDYGVGTWLTAWMDA
jgi:ketosteroid isomerase-like protein